jgi:ribosomal protein S18 acetylase RimI-like enzyme
MEYAIHPMRIEDHDLVMALWRETDGIVLSDTDEREPMQRFLNRNPGLSFVAHYRGQLAGAVLCSQDGRRGYMHHLATRKELRRQGIGSALVQEALSRLNRVGIRKCNIFILPENDEGMTFWQHNGFRPLPQYDWMQAITETND